MLKNFKIKTKYNEVYDITEHWLDQEKNEKKAEEKQ